MTSGRPASSDAGIPLSFASRVLAGTLLRLFHDGGKVVCRVGIDVEGGAEASRHPQSIIAANHNSLVDTPVVFMTLDRRRRRRTATVGGLDYFRASASQPWMERLFRRAAIWFIQGAMNVLLIDRKGGEYSELDRIDALLADGWSLVIFPEATRSRDGRMGRFRLGAAELARRHDLPIVPAHIAGTDGVLPPGVRWPQPGRLRVRFGEPLFAEDGESASTFTQRIRGSIERLGEEQVDAAPAGVVL